MARPTKITYKSISTKRAELESMIVTDNGGLMLTQEFKNDSADALMSYDKDEAWALWNSLSKRAQSRLRWIAYGCLGEESYDNFENMTRVRAMKNALREQAEQYLAEELGKLEAREKAVREAEKELAKLRVTHDIDKGTIVALESKLERAEKDAQYWMGRTEGAIESRDAALVELTAIKAALALIGKLARGE
jgi:hypothetical protein